MLLPFQRKIYNVYRSPARVQDFLDTLAINFETSGDTCMGPRMVLETKKAHCLEGAMLAASMLKFLGFKPLLLDLRAQQPPDVDHVVALFRIHGFWGAISKSNHATLRYRDPIYKTVRELALSYFHEYFDDNGNKNLRDYSRPISLRAFDYLHWETTTNELWEVSTYLDSTVHYAILSPAQQRSLRKAGALEIATGKLVEWKLNEKNPLVKRVT